MNKETTKKSHFEKEAVPHLDAIWETAQWLFSSEQDAEKLAEDAFSEAYQIWDETISGQNRRIWMFKVLIRVLNRKVKLNFQPLPSDYASDQFEQYPSDGFPLVSSIPKEIIADSIRLMPIENRLVIILSIFEGLSYTEIANIIGIPKRIVSLKILQGYLFIHKELLNYHDSGRVGLALTKCS